MRVYMLCALIASSIAIGGVFFFQDGVVFERDVSDMWKIPEGVDVLNVDADWWKVEESDFNWTNLLKSSELERCENPWDFGKLRILSMDPLVLSNGKKCFSYLSSPGIWVSFDCPKMVQGKFLRVSSTSKALLFSEGGWRAIYELRDRELKFSAELSTRTPLADRFYLITGKFKGISEAPVYRALEKSMATGAPVKKVAQRKVYEIGELSVPAGKTVEKLFSGTVKEIDEMFYSALSVRSSTDWTKARYTLVIENSEENGLGYPMPDGIVYVFEKGVPIGEFKLEGAQIGEKLRIVENESDEVKVKMTVSSSFRKEGKVLRNLVLSIRNLSGNDVKVLVKLLGSGMELLGTEITPLEKADDYITFKLRVPEGEKSFKISIKNDY